MTKQTAKILAILFAFFSISAIGETFSLLNSDASTFTPVAVILTAGFIWTANYFWKKSKKTDLN